MVLRLCFCERGLPSGANQVEVVEGSEEVGGSRGPRRSHAREDHSEYKPQPIL